MDTAHQRTSSRRGLFVRLGFTAALLALVAWVVDFQELGAVFTSLHWGMLLLALALAFVDRVLATIRWWSLLRARRVEVSFMSLLVLHLHAAFLGGFLPTTFSVDAVRIVMLSSRTGKTVECIATSVVDRAMMLLGTTALAVPMGFLLVTTGVARNTALPAAALWGIAALLIAAPVAMLAALVAFLLSGKAMAARLRSMTGNVVTRVLGTRLANHAATLYWALHDFHRYRGVLLAGAAITVAMLAVRLLFVIVLAWTVRAEPIIVGLLIAAPVVWVVLMMPISIGGLGFQEIMYAALFGMAGITATLAVSMSLLEHALVRIATLPGTLIWAAGSEGKAHAATNRFDGAQTKISPPSSPVPGAAAASGSCGK